MARWLCYILISLFSFVGSAGVCLKTDINAVEIDKGFKALATDCKEENKKKDACCVNSARCPDGVLGKIGDALSEIAPTFVKGYVQYKGAFAGGDPFKICQYNNIAQAVDPLNDSFSMILKKSCSDAMEICKETCKEKHGDLIKDLIKDFIKDFIKKDISAGPHGNFIEICEGILFNGLDNIGEIENLDFDELKEIFIKVVDLIDKVLETENKINTKYEEHFGKSLESMEDTIAENCDKVLGKLDKEAFQKSVRPLQLQLCQKAVNNAGDYVSNPQPLFPKSSPNISPGYITGNQDSPQPSGGQGEFPNTNIGEGFPINTPGKRSKNNKFGSLTGGSGGPGGGSGGPGGGSGGPGGGSGGPGNYGDYYSGNYYGWSSGTGSSGGSANPEDFDSSDSAGSLTGNGDSKKLASNVEYRRLNKITDYKRGKSIFQMASYRIQKYCSEKIRSKCL